MSKQEKIDALKKMIKATNEYIPSCSYGLCGVSNLLYCFDDFSKQEVIFISVLIRSLPVNPYYPYRWERGAKVPRIKWLKEQIKLLENK